MSIAGRRNKPFYEQNLSKPNRFLWNCDDQVVSALNLEVGASARSWALPSCCSLDKELYSSLSLFTIALWTGSEPPDKKVGGIPRWTPIIEYDMRWRDNRYDICRFSQKVGGPKMTQMIIQWRLYRYKLYCRQLCSNFLSITSNWLIYCKAISFAAVRRREQVLSTFTSFPESLWDFMKKKIVSGIRKRKLVEYARNIHLLRYPWIWVFRDLNWLSNQTLPQTKIHNFP